MQLLPFNWKLGEGFRLSVMTLNDMKLKTKSLQNHAIWNKVWNKTRNQHRYVCPFQRKCVKDKFDDRVGVLSFTPMDSKLCPVSNTIYELSYKFRVNVKTFENLHLKKLSNWTSKNWRVFKSLFRLFTIDRAQHPLWQLAATSSKSIVNFSWNILTSSFSNIIRKAIQRLESKEWVIVIRLKDNMSHGDMNESTLG